VDQEAPDGVFPLVIVGLGQMGSAMAKGIVGAYPRAKGLIFGHDQNPLRVAEAEAFGLEGTKKLEEVLSRARTILLALKPLQVLPWLRLYRETFGKDVMLISIAAGVPIKAFREVLGEKAHVARVMPNLAVALRTCPVGVSCEPGFPEEKKALLIEALSLVGMPIELEEGQLDALTALSSSGIAFVWHALEGFAAAGIRLGLPAALSRKVAVETFLGAGMLAKEDEAASLASLKERVTTPKGTTMEGLFVLERLGLKGILIEAITSAYNRTQAMLSPQKGV
jgi:pyrroline-5-carboxylate reductase